MVEPIDSAPRPVEDSAKPKKPAPSRRRRIFVWVRRVVFYGLLLLLTVILIQAWVPMGMRPLGARLSRMVESPQWEDGVFENPQPIVNDVLGSITGFLDKSEYAVPRRPVPVHETDPALFDRAPTDGVRITWLGHSTTIVEIDGVRFLTDPVWGDRTSPVTWIGPKRWYPPPLALTDLPDVDAILISHDHYDHLDYRTVVWLAENTEVPFVAPLGVGAHLEYWGVPADRVRELDWWDEEVFGDVTVTCTPARHASGRQVFDQNRTLWAGYAMVSDSHRVFFSGDTGLFDGMREIGERLGPFDLTMLEVGAYGAAWPDWHLGPEQAVIAHKWLGGNVMLPVHWGLFDLAMHGWTAPIERVRVAAAEANVPLAQPRPGESFELQPIPTDAWWPSVPWRSASEDPIVSHDVTRDE